MDSGGTTPKIQEEGFRGFEFSEISYNSCNVTKKSLNDVSESDRKHKIETENNDGAGSSVEIGSKETTSNFSCDNTSFKNKQIEDCSGDIDCDIKVNISKETIELSESNEITDDKNGIVSENTLIETKRLPISVDTIPTTSPICVSPAVKKLKNNIQSPNAAIQEVVDKVNKLDIIDKVNLLGACINPATAQLSSVIVKNESSSLRNLLMYQSDTSDEEDNEDVQATWQNHVFPSSSCSSDSESDSQECVEISDDDDNVEFVLPNTKSQPKKDAKSDLEQMDIGPPLDLSNLQIDYEKEQFLHIGHISNFINSTVTIDTLEHMHSYDLETVLFIDDKTSKRPLGGITDVIGPVSRPVYCVQLRDPKDIEKVGLKEGMKVYSAPKNSCTKYVFLKDLLKMKGTDASWVGDEERPSDEEEDTSEEEVEVECNSRKRTHNNSLERHKQFEKAKNRSNLIKSQFAFMMDSYKAKSRGDSIHMFPHGFDPRVPPPTLQPNVQHTSQLQQQPSLLHNRPISNPCFESSPKPNNRQGFVPRSRNHLQTRPQQNNRQQNNRTNYFANNMGYHHNHNSPGPSRQNHY